MFSRIKKEGGGRGEGDERRDDCLNEISEMCIQKLERARDWRIILYRSSCLTTSRVIRFRSNISHLL